MDEESIGDDDANFSWSPSTRFLICSYNLNTSDTQRIVGGGKLINSPSILASENIRIEIFSAVIQSF